MTINTARPALVTPQSLGFFTFDSILRQRGEDAEEEQVPLLAYPVSRQSVDDYELFTGAQLNRLVDGAAKALIKVGFEPVYEENIVGILGASDLDYVVTIFALGRLGYTSFLLSPRLAPRAVATLLQNQNAAKLVYADHLTSLASDAAEEYKVQLTPLLLRSQYDIPNGTSPPFSREPIDPKKEALRKYIMFHSSGSTGLPKPIHHQNARLLATILTAQPYRSFSSLPLFHAHGFITLVQAIWLRKTLYLFNGHIPQTHNTVTQAIKAAKPEYVLTVPYVLKLMAEKREGIEVLRAVRTVSITGSRCPDELGDMLTKEGVWVGSAFGSTEVAQILNSLNRPREDTAWNYLRPPPHVAPFILMRPVQGDVYECIVLDGHRGKMISNSDNPPNSYHTSDLFVAHATIPNAWKFIGRLDDRITLTTGEKVLPLQIEGRITQESIVSEAVMFGVEREVPGVMIFRTKCEILSDEEFLERVWPAIEDANSRAEGFSQISRDMVIIMPQEVECPITDKSSIKRAQIYRDFADVIDAAYSRLESLQEGSLSLDVDEMEIWIIKTAQELGIRLEDETTSFFDAGVDSLKAIQIRGLLVKILDLGGKAATVPSMVVYDCGNTTKLARRLVDIRDGIVRDQGEVDEIAEMQDMIERFSIFHKRARIQKRKSAENAVVLLTGATGSLGSHVLSQLVQFPHITKIFCLIHKISGHQTASERLDEVARERHLPHISDAKAIPILADLREPSFGFPVGLFDELRSHVTHIIHCAWNVNFALPVSAFEAQIQQVQNLISFSLSTPFEEPSRLFFCSSIGAALGTPPGTAEETLISEAPIELLECASPTGYARSKLVAEKVIQNAVEKFGARATILRIGQIIPAPNIGTQLWNQNEMIPLILRSALAIGVLPDVPGPTAGDECYWIDAGTLAKTTAEIAGLSTTLGSEQTYNPGQFVYNLLNPRSVSWKTEFLPSLRKAGLKFEIVSWSTWIEKLRDDGAGVDNNPSRKLLDFWESAEIGGAEKSAKAGPVRFDTKKAEARSESLRETVNVVDDAYARKLLGAWRDVW